MDIQRIATKWYDKHFINNGIGNYDIATKNDDASNASKPLTLNIQKYELENSSSSTLTKAPK
jgi:hypothetical protein